MQRTVWLFGGIFVIMALILIFKPDWVRGAQEEPETFQPLSFTTNPVPVEPSDQLSCVYYWRVDGLAQITRIMDSLTAGPYPVVPHTVDVDFYPVRQVVFTEGKSTREEILKLVTIPRPYMLGQWDPTYLPEITFLRRECKYLPPKPEPR